MAGIMRRKFAVEFPWLRNNLSLRFYLNKMYVLVFKFRLISRGLLGEKVLQVGVLKCVLNGCILPLAVRGEIMFYIHVNAKFKNTGLH